MTWTPYCLRAASEATLAAALPMLRSTNEVGKAIWLTSGQFHALDPAIPIVAQPAVSSLNALGIEIVLSAAIMDNRWHANLAVRDDNPQRAAIVAAIAPYVIVPASPSRVWA